MNKYDILAWFFPNKCLLCGGYVRAGEPVCPACRAGVSGPIERNFNLPMGRKSRLFKVYATGSYEGFCRQAVEQFKFGGKTAYARKFAALIGETCGEERFKEHSLITCVPMEPGKRKGRGYNQAELLAKSCAPLFHAQYADLLEVSGKRQVQHNLSAEERKKNSIDSYRVKSDVMGQNIILVDDIITTGSTICACARLLFQAGAADVVGLCAANTPRASDGGRNEAIERVCE